MAGRKVLALLLATAGASTAWSVSQPIISPRRMRHGIITCCIGEPLRILVPIAEDSEEIELACIADTLVRAGAAVTVASVSGTLQVSYAYTHLVMPAASRHLDLLCTTALLRLRYACLVVSRSWQIAALMSAPVKSGTRLHCPVACLAQNICVIPKR